MLKNLVGRRHKRVDASSEAFTAVMFHVDVFCVMTPCCVVLGHQRFRRPICRSEDGGSTDLRNVGVLKQQASQHRRPRREISMKISEG